MIVGVQVPLRVLFLKRKRFRSARIAQLVEHDLAKVGVAGSSPVSRSKFKVAIIGDLFSFSDIRTAPLF